MTDEQRTYTGGCHCGRVRYQVELNLQLVCGQQGARQRRTTYRGAFVKPAAFKLLSGEDSLYDCTFNARSVHHLFCKRCGTRSFCRGDIPEIGGAYITVNLNCLDDIELSNVRAPLVCPDRELNPV